MGLDVARQRSKEQRREEILESTWRLIARDGLAASNMRALAAEAGYANGALAYYFDSKEELLHAAYEYVSRQTMKRITEATRDLRGIEALRAFCVEVVPDSALKLLEARVVVPFWSTALTDASFADTFDRDMKSWRKQMLGHLAEAVKSGEIPPPRDRGAQRRAVEELLSMLSGMQVLAVLTPTEHSPRMMRNLVEAALQRLCASH